MAGGRISAGVGARLTRVLASLLLCASLPRAIAQDGKSAADYYVDSLPGAPDPLVKMHAGHIEIAAEHHGNLFFWHFANRHIGTKERTVIWLNGGPGCSSIDGAAMEVGPYRLDGENLRLINGSWNEYANLLFVDQPVGTGFSYIDSDSYLHDLDQASDHMVIFLEKYFSIFPEEVANDLYIAGESYAGQYIPYVAQAIINRNKNAAKKWNLQGLLIGNGWISPTEQYLSYLPYAYKENLLKPDTPQSLEVEKQLAQCRTDLSDAKDKVGVGSCERILNEILRVTHDMPNMDGQCYNMYDVRKTDTYNSCGMNWPEDLSLVTPYFQREDVMRALHVNTDKHTGWRECNNQVSAAFRAANSVPSVRLLPDLLAEIPILLFSGDRDLICNHLGTESFINNLKWNGGTGMETSPGVTSPKLDWTFNNDKAGLYQSARNLTYVLFYNSSHMVPYDYPERARDMLDRFMGVDYKNVLGHVPADSAIDGLPSSKNNTLVDEQRLQQERWDAYYRSGEVALVVVLAIVSLWGYFYLRTRRRAGYRGLFGDEDNMGPSAGFLPPRHKSRDVEAADFDEAELDDLTRPKNMPRYGDASPDRFNVGEEEEESDEEARGDLGRANGAL